MKKLIHIILLLIPFPAFSQDWINTTYTILSEYDIEYGVSIDFKGVEFSAQMDVSVPVNDTPPECGRPLLVIVHGGAWYGGDKSEGYSDRLREDFAKRGYVTASVNYRQGMFNTNQEIDCVLGEWKCWNMTDSTEWYRANYRAIQDVHGAIRFMVNEKETYDLNSDNIFLIGESAGGFVALGAGFIDDPSEILEELVGELQDAPAPNSIYQDDCIVEFGLANSISEMNFNRPSLGTIEGNLNFPAQESYRIRGVGSFYGGVFNNIFETHAAHSPALYLFHQPCDLIVPFSYNKLLDGYSTCATQFPTFCQHIINRPFVYGGNAITSLIDGLEANNIPTCEYIFDNSGNTYSCAEQVINPSFGCHALDNYVQRTINVATFFADKIADCAPTSSNELTLAKDRVKIYPNPARNEINLKISTEERKIKVRIVDILGKEHFNKFITHPNQYSINVSNYHQGIYQILIEFEDKTLAYPLIKI